MSEEQIIELQIKAQAEQAKTGIDSLVKSLINVENVLTNIYLELGQIESKSKTGVTRVFKEVNNFSNGVSKSTIKATDSLSKLGRALSFGGLYLGARKVVYTYVDWMNKAIDYTEQLNLFNVVFKNIKESGVQTFSKLGQEATKYQNKLNEAFGTNKTETLYMQAIFQSMGESAGIKDTYASIMSEAMTNLTYDLASLFNSDEKDVAEALRAGVFASQTKPLRKYGIDVTQNTMKPLLEALGITDRTVSELSYAEKEILRYIATLKQAKVAMGDMVNSIESPSNQLKVFRQQLAEVKVAIQSLFIGTFSKILPYANALLMVVKEVTRAIATLFGIKLTDYNSGIATSDYNDYLDDIGDSADDASGKVKELKRQVLSFDQIHNINEPKNNGSGTNISGGIDQRLLDAIKGYDNGLDKVRMKATEIRDRIMEWLGLTKEIDPITGEISWKFSDTNSTLYKIVKAFKDIIKFGGKAISGVFNIIKKDFDNGIFGKVLIGVFQAIADFFKYIAKHKNVQTIIAKIVESFLLFKTIKIILNPVVTLFKSLVSGAKTGAGYFETFKNQLKGTNNYIIDSDGSLKKYTKTLENHNNVVLNADETVNKFQTTILRAKTALSGIAMSVAGLYTIRDAMKSINDEGINVTNVLELILGSLSNISGFATIGSIFGPMGTVIGAIIGSVETLITVIWSSDTEIDKLKEKYEKQTEEVKKYTDSIKNSIIETEKQISNNLVETNFHKDLVQELKNITDENGRVKQGYEDRAKAIVETLNNAYGTEIKIIDGVIGKIDEQLSKIDEMIYKKQIELILDGKQQEYSDARSRKLTDYTLMVEKEKELNDKKEERNKLDQDYIDHIQNYAYDPQVMASYTEKYQNEKEKLSIAIDELEEQHKSYTETYANDVKIISDYDSLLTASMSENTDAMSKAIEDYTNTVIISHDDVLNSYVATYGTILNEAYASGIEYLKQRGKTLDTATDMEKDAAFMRYNYLKSSLMDESKTIEQLTPEIIDKWGTLASESEQEFMEMFNNLPDYIQSEIISKMYEQGYSISDELQKGINQSPPTIKFEADTSSATKKINSLTGLIQNMSTIASTVINSAFKTNEQGGVFKNGTWKSIPKYANGGIPSHGSLFVAGERGAEIVGHLNGRTEVLNQSQLASVMYNAITSAMSKFNAGSQIDVFVHSDEGVIVDRINQKTKQTGVCPINIPY